MGTVTKSSAPAAARAAAPHRDVQFTGEQGRGRGRRVQFLEDHPDVRPGPPEPAEHARQRVEQRGPDEPDPQPPGLPARGAARVDRREAHLGERAARPGEEGIARGGGENAARGAVEQPLADLAFECGDLGRERRLGDAERRRGAAEMLVLGERQSVAKMTGFHAVTIRGKYDEGIRQR